MATFTVTTALDAIDPNDGRLSLREAVAQANATAAADAIRFAAGLEGQTLALTGGELTLTRDVAIDGDRDNDGSEVTLDGGGVDQVLNIAGTGTDASLRDLAVTGGRGDDFQESGGIFLGAGNGLALTGCTVSGNLSSNTSGGIYAASGSRLTVVGCSIRDNGGYDGGGIASRDAAVVITDSWLAGNNGGEGGGGLHVLGGSLVLARSTISDNATPYGQSAGILAGGARVSVSDSTISGNTAKYDGVGGIAANGGELVVRNSTITGNLSYGPESNLDSGGIAVRSSARLDIANSVVAGNFIQSETAGSVPQANDIFGTITLSNGHNIFGSAVSGDVAGDRENVAPSALFAALDPDTGGGLLAPGGIVLLRDDPANPALSGGDPLAAGAVGQLGTTPRPLPPGSLPDIGAIEISHALSTSPSGNNDVLTGNGGANALSGMDGNDLLRGLAGLDALDGGDGSDLLDGGSGNDELNGGAGVDIAAYNTASTAVVVDLSGATDTARRGTETDTLTGIEGAIGSSAADTFRGDALANSFRGGGGKDTFTGGGGRDLYDLNTVSDSPAGSGRDVVSDFAHLVDDLDLAGIDANTGVAGDQAFRFVGTAGLGTTPGAVGYYTSGGNTIVRASTDADSTAELEIQLTGLITPTVDDFYL